MLESAEDAATAAVLSLLLEVSGNPKSGNVDREHDFEDMRYEDFLASAAAAFPAFLMAAKGYGIGECIYKAVERSVRWQSAGNVHFGAFLLLVPLASAWGKGMEGVAARAVEKLKSTSVEDSLLVLKAFRLVKPRVLKTERLSLESDEVAEVIASEGLNLYDWMMLAPRENLIARELVSGYRISLMGARMLMSFGDAREAVVRTYHLLLSKFPDPLVISKAGRRAAEEVMELAAKAVEIGTMDAFRKLDDELVRRRLNPGTIADLTASSIYLAFCEGWRV